MKVTTAMVLQRHNILKVTTETCMYIFCDDHNSITNGACELKGHKIANISQLKKSSSFISLPFPFFLSFDFFFSLSFTVFAHLPIEMLIHNIKLYFLLSKNTFIFFLFLKIKLWI